MTQQQKDLLIKIFPEEYINIMSNKCIELFCNAFISILKTYPDKDEQEYRIRKDSAKKDPLNQSRLYPKLKDLKKPYYSCPLDKLKAIILLVEPYNNGFATGFPLEIKYKEYPQKTRLTSLQQELECLEEYIGLNFKDPDFPFDNGLDFEYISLQGILVIHTSLTSEEAKNFAHYKIWFDFTLEFLYCLFKHNNDVVLLTIGEVLQMSLLTLPKELKVINAPNCFYQKEERLRFREFKPIEKLNEALTSLGLKPIDFRPERIMEDIIEVEEDFDINYIPDDLPY